MTWKELVESAIRTSNLAPRGQDIDPQLYEDALVSLSFVLSELSRDEILPPNTDAVEHALTSGVDSYTMGPTGDFSSRPIELFQAILYGATLGAVRLPLAIRPYAEFEALTFPTAPGLPSRVFFNPTYPLATLTVYPTPNNTWTLRMVGKFAWPAVNPDAQISLPPGYDAMIHDAEAVRVCEDNNRQVDPVLRQRARNSKSAVILAMPTNDRTRNNQKTNLWRETGVYNWNADRPT